MPSTTDFIEYLSTSNIPVQAPGIFNGLSARMAEANHGFKVCYVSGATVSASIGVPDIGIAQLVDFTRVIREISSVSNLFIVADADTGFGEGTEVVQKIVHDYYTAGAHCLHLEDQEFPKRCGHLDGKTLVSVESHAAKIRAAVDATSRLPSGGSDFVICARTDAFAVEGMDGAVERSVRYICEGARMLFPEGLPNVEAFVTFRRRVLDALGQMSPVPNVFFLANMTEFGKSQYFRPNELPMYDIIIYPVSTFRCAMKAVDDALRELNDSGGFDQYLDKMQHRQELYKCLNYTPGAVWNYPEKYSGK